MYLIICSLRHNRVSGLSLCLENQQKNGFLRGLSNNFKNLFEVFIASFHVSNENDSEFRFVMF